MKEEGAICDKRIEAIEASRRSGSIRFSKGVQLLDRVALSLISSALPCKRILANSPYGRRWLLMINRGNTFSQGMF